MINTKKRAMEKLWDQLQVIFSRRLLIRGGCTAFHLEFCESQSHNLTAALEQSLS